MPSVPIIIFNTLLLLFEDYVFLNLKEVITIIALKANLFLEHAKQMGLPFLNICDILIDLGVDTMGLPLPSSYWGNYLFLDQAKQMGLPFPDICERCPKIVQGADGPEQ